MWVAGRIIRPPRPPARNGEHSGPPFWRISWRAARLAGKPLKSVDPQALEEAVELLASANWFHIIVYAAPSRWRATLLCAGKDAGAAMLHSVAGRLDTPPRFVRVTRCWRYLLALFAKRLDLSRRSCAGRAVVALTDTGGQSASQDGATILTVSEVDFGAFRSFLPPCAPPSLFRRGRCRRKV